MAGEKPAGSFSSLSGLRTAAQDQRDDRLAAEKQAEEDAKKKAAEAEKAKEPAAPKPVVHVSLIHGEMTDADLAAKYPEIKEQVSQKNYLMQGFATHDIKLGATTITLRTLRKSEQRVVSMLSEGELAATGEQIYHPDDLNRWSLVFALAKIGQQNFEPVAVPSVGAAKRFIKDSNSKLQALAEGDEVKKRLTVIEGWPAPFFQLVLSHFMDISAAYQRAILQDMQNPS